MNQQEVQNKIAAWFPLDVLEPLVRQASRITPETEDRYRRYGYFKPIEVSFAQKQDDHGYHYWDLNISQRVLGNLLKMSLKHVEECCAMMFIYGFSVNDILSKEQLKELIDDFLMSASDSMWFTSRRFIINMVEYSGHYNPLEEVTGDVNKLHYKRIYDYFVDNAERVRSMLMPNANGGNIIHHMEVLFSREYFPSNNDGNSSDDEDFNDDD